MSAALITLLTIDGDTSSRAERARALRHAGYNVAEASGEIEARRLIETARPRLVLIGGDMPDEPDSNLPLRLTRDFPTLQIIQIGRDGASAAQCALSRQVAPADLVAVIGALLQVQAQADADALRSTDALRHARNLAALGQFNGSQIHDFNNLLHAIRASLELISARTSEDRVAKLAQHGLAAVERSGAVAARLVSIARRQNPPPAPVDVNRLIREIAERLTRTIEPGIELELDLAPAIGPARADAEQLELAILNLTTNGCDAMPDGGRLTLRTGETGSEASETAQFVEIHVLDTGHGMPASVLGRALEPFFTTKEQPRRSGLGLAQVAVMAEQSGGTLQLQSRVAQGTTAHLRLPRATGWSIFTNQASPPDWYVL